MGTFKWPLRISSMDGQQAWDGPEPCRHIWGKSETVSPFSGTEGKNKVRSGCRGFVHMCRGCGGYYLVDEGQGEYPMPP